MEKHRMHRRTHYFIDKDFQAKFIIKFCLLIVATSLLTGALIYYLNRQTTTVAFDDLRVVVKSTSDFILPIVLEVLAGVTLVVGVATIIIALLTSHKIVGPIYRLKIELDKIKHGDLSSSIHIRSKDQLQKVASDLEEVRIGFKDSVNSLKVNWDSIKANLQKLAQETEDEEKKRSIADDIGKIDSELARFKIN
jgi:methyl-accepting chemotaxis protein